MYIVAVGVILVMGKLKKKLSGLFRFACLSSSNIDAKLKRIPGYGDESSGNFQYGKFLGKGASSVVYKVVDKETSKIYALKLMSKYSNPRERFMNELKIHYSLKCHGNVVPMLAAFEDDQNFYILMEMTVKGRLNCTGCGIQEGLLIKDIMKQVLAAVYYCHQNGVLHRDIKPNNFLISSDRKIMLTDFGVSCRLQFPEQKCTFNCGTRLFAAPQVQNQPYGLKADMYSVGVTMYVLLRGYEAEEINGTAMLLFPDTSFLKSLSAPCRELLESLLSHDEDSRPSAEQALNHKWFREDSN